MHMPPQHSRYDVFDAMEKARYGTLYDAHDRNTKREVVVLEIDSRFRADQALWERMWLQIQQLMGSKLENVVQIFDAYEPNGWIILEKMRGTLSDKIVKGPLPPDQVRSVLQQILESLQSLHAVGIWHGDVKTANLLYNTDGFSRLSFSPGLSIGGQVLKRESGFKYTAPELITPAFGTVGAGVDLYALGFSALELLKGPAFDTTFKGVAGSVAGIDTAWLRWHGSNAEQLPPANSFVGNIPPEFTDLCSVIDRLVKKNVADRYSTAEDALRDLKRGPIVRIEVVNDGVKTPVSAGMQKHEFVKTLPPTVVKKEQPAATPKAVAGAAHRWLDHFRRQPVLYSAIAAVIVLSLVLVLVRVFVPPGTRTVDVTIESAPAGGSVTLDCRMPDGTIDRRVLDGKTPQTTALNPGKYTATVDMAEYSPGTREFEVNATSGPMQVAITLTKKLDKDKSRQQNRPPPFTIPGLIPADNFPADAETHLPTMVIAQKLKAAGVPLAFRLVKPAHFTYGVPAEQRFSGELTGSDTTVDQAFYISMTEITNAQYAAFAKHAGEAKAGLAWKEVMTLLGPDADRHPVVKVSITQAQAFCSWITADCRLPREKEWEFAARGVTNRMYPWSSHSALTRDLCNFRFSSAPGTVPVDALPAGATPDGLTHMLGNVAEWCSDIYAAGFKDETDDPGIGKYPTIRGGSYKDAPLESTRLTMRATAAPDGAEDIGIRAVIPVKPTAGNRSK
jgi:formylglycine-generating enzyme required for sulfatase activity/serine/threonine protein kinase